MRVKYPFKTSSKIAYQTYPKISSNRSEEISGSLLGKIVLATKWQFLN